VHLVGFCYKTISRCTVLLMSRSNEEYFVPTKCATTSTFGVITERRTHEKNV